jgi:hypothetical protein
MAKSTLVRVIFAAGLSAPAAALAHVTEPGWKPRSVEALQLATAETGTARSAAVRAQQRDSIQRDHYRHLTCCNP